MCVCVCVCVCERERERERVFYNVYIMYTLTHTHTHARTHARTHTHIHTHTVRKCIRYNACPMAKEAYHEKEKEKKHTSSIAGGSAREVREASSRKRMSSGASTPVSFTRLFSFRLSSRSSFFSVEFRKSMSAGASPVIYMYSRFGG